MSLFDIRILGLILAVIAGLPASGAQTPGPDAFAREPEFENVRISPTGRYLAVLKRENLDHMLTVIDLESSQVISTLRPERRQGIENVSWVNEERVMGNLLRRISDEDKYARCGDVFAMDADGHRRTMLFGPNVFEQTVGTRITRAGAEQAGGEIIDPLEYDDRHALIAAHGYTGIAEDTPIVMKLDVYSGVTRTVTRTPMTDAVVKSSRDHTLWVAQGKDLQGRDRLMWRDQENLDWMPLLQEATLEDSVELVSVDSERGLAMILSNLDTPTVALVAVDVRTGERTVAAADFRYDVSWPLLDPDGYETLAACFDAVHPRCDYLDPDQEISRLHAHLRESFGNAVVEFESWTRDRSKVVVKVSSDRMPGDYYLFDRNKMKANLLFSSCSWLDAEVLSPVRSIAFQARDGQLIEGYITFPPGETGPGPLVVMVHDDPHGARDRWQYDPEVQLLAQQGYTVLQVNYRGSAGYGRAFRRAGFAHWGDRIQDDIIDGIQWLSDHDWADPDRVCIYGRRFGAYSAVRASIENPGVFRCAIATNGFYDLTKLADSWQARAIRGTQDYLAMATGGDVELQHRHSPLHDAERMKVPLLVAYGEHDHFAEPEQSRSLVSALGEAGSAPEVFVMAREGPTIVNEETRKAYFERLLSFLEARLVNSKLAVSQP